MTTAIYMKVTPSGGAMINGGSVERAHTNWFEVDAVTAGLETNVTFPGSGASVSRPTAERTSVRLSQQSGIADLILVAASAKPCTILIEMWHPFGNAAVRKIFNYEYTTTYIASLMTIDDSSPAGDTVQLELVYPKVVVSQLLYNSNNATAVPNSTKIVTLDYQRATFS